MGGKIYGAYYYSVAVAAIGGFLIQLYVVDSFGYEVLFLIMSAPLIGSLIILNLVFVEKNPWASKSIKITLDERLI